MTEANQPGLFDRVLRGACRIDRCLNDSGTLDSHGGLFAPLVRVLLNEVESREALLHPSFAPEADIRTLDDYLDVASAIKELKVRGGRCQAWLLNKKLYLRTNLTVISPGWQSIMSSIDGTHAYQLQPAPIILALQNGRDKVLTLMLEGLE